MEKQETKGRAVITSLFDAGTFVETGAYVRRPGETYDAVLCGYGAVEGKLCFAFVQDSDRKKGAFDELGAKKIASLYEQAVRTGAPVIGVFDSAGAVVVDGVSVLSAYGKLMSCVSGASGIVPQIALVTGVCGGMAAVTAGLFDLTVTVKDTAELFVNPPVLAGKDTGSSANAAKAGLSALTADSDAAAVAAVRSLVALLPSNNKDNADVAADGISAVVVDGLTGEALIRALCDDGRFTALYADYDASVVTGLCRMGGTVTGVVASDASVGGGKITAKGAAKAARLISFCDSFALPVVTLVDSEGVDTSADPALAPALGKLASAYLTAACPKVTAVTGKAWGSAFTLLGSRALGADMAYAVDGCEVSVMDPAAAVAFLCNDQITADKSRADVEAEWKAGNASAKAAAEAGAVDDVIPGEELRARLCAALYMLSGKADGTPERKHPVLPL